MATDRLYMNASRITDEQLTPYSCLAVIPFGVNHIYALNQTKCNLKTIH